MSVPKGLYRDRPAGSTSTAKLIRLRHEFSTSFRVRSKGSPLLKLLRKPRRADLQRLRHSWALLRRRPRVSPWRLPSNRPFQAILAMTSRSNLDADDRNASSSRTGRHRSTDVSLLGLCPRSPAPCPPLNSAWHEFIGNFRREAEGTQGLVPFMEKGQFDCELSTMIWDLLKTRTKPLF